MFPMDRNPVGVTIEYDSQGKRVRKVFTCAFAARRFYTAKDQGKG